MIVAVDTSALAKLLVEEVESTALRDYFVDAVRLGDEFAISAVAVTELRRLTIRLRLDQSLVDPIVRPFRTIRLPEAMLQIAGRLSHPHLGTVDAIHIATALSVEAGALVSYDDRQCAAAEREGLTAISPGR